MADSVDEQIYGLIAVAQDQQAAVRAALDGLAIERAELSKDRVTLIQAGERMQRLSDELAKAVIQVVPRILEASSQGATQAVNAAIVGVGFETTQAVAAAAEPILDRIAGSVNAAGVAQRQLQHAVRDFRSKWLWVVGASVAAAVLAVALASLAAVWWQLRELEELSAQRDRLAAEVGALQAEQARRAPARKARP